MEDFYNSYNLIASSGEFIRVMNRVHRCLLTVMSIEVSVDLKTVAKTLMYMYVISFMKRSMSQIFQSKHFISPCKTALISTSNQLQSTYPLKL